jgi:hypothetical protein
MRVAISWSRSMSPNKVKDEDVCTTTMLKPQDSLLDFTNKGSC